MSDYLTNVIARSFGVEPAIRPRLVSLFEPSRVDLPVFENEVEAERPVRQETAPVERKDVRGELDESPSPPPPLPSKQRRRAPVSPEPIERLLSNDKTRVDKVSQPVDSPAAKETPRRAPQPSAASPKEEDQTARPQPTRVVAEKVEAVSERREIVSRKPSPSTAPSAPTEQATPVTPPSIRTNLEDRKVPPPLAPPWSAAARRRFDLRSQDREKSGARPPHSKETSNQTGPKTDSPKPVITRVEREIETRNVVTHLTPSPTTPPSVSPPPNVVHPISVAPALRIDKEDSTTPSEPTIHVTIGRVEVRSVVADERKKSQSAKQSRLMSLEDYLRQRAQGAKS